jgi:hypothetical protein
MIYLEFIRHPFSNRRALMTRHPFIDPGISSFKYREVIAGWMQRSANNTQ